MLLHGKRWGPDCQDWEGQQKGVILGAKKSSLIHRFLHLFRELHSPDLLAASTSCLPALDSSQPARLPRASPSLYQSNVSVLHPHTPQSTSKYWESLLISTQLSFAPMPASTLTLVGSFCGKFYTPFAVCCCWHHVPCPACGSFLGLSK